MEIKAIDTVYNGYRFRSRLEARWAVFFDKIDIEFEYEKEGYDLGKDGWYLPDFWLPKYKLWIEIKPFNGTPSSVYDEAHKKAEALRNSTTYPVLLCYGEPKLVWNYLYACDTTDSGAGNYEEYATFADGFLMVNDTWSSRTICTTEFEPLDKIKTINEGCPIYFGRKNYELMDHKEAIEKLTDQEFFQMIETGKGRTWEAARSARQARFEHGEHG